MAIADFELGLTPYVEHGFAVHSEDLLDDVPGFGAVAAGVPGTVGKKFGPLTGMHRRKTRHFGSGHPGFCINAAIAQLRTPRSGMHQDHRPRKPAIAHQQVAAKADEQRGLRCRQLAQERREVLQIGRQVEDSRAPARPPADMARHRLIAPEVAAQSMEMQRFGHVHVNCAATLPIEPAPMVTTTSPLCATRRMASGSAVMSSTNTGSTLPATRTARASDRPSAAMIGASPAG